MGKIWDFIKTSYEWCCNNTDTLVLIIIGIICVILAPFLIGIIKSLVKGIWSIFKFIYSIVSYPFKLINRIVTYLNNRKSNIGASYYTVTA